MKPAPDGLPMLGADARSLGVRTPEDILVNDGFVEPQTGGISVATGSYWNLPPHRRPKPLGQGSSGNKGDFIYEASIPFKDERLTVRPQTPPEEHAVIEPAIKMPFSEYENALAGTRSAWRKVWPE
jgi:hypothetical protein